MADKNNLNISLGVDVDGLQKSWEKAVIVTQKSGKDLEKQAAAMAVKVTAAIDKMSTKSQVRQLENLANKMTDMGLEGTKAFNDVIAGAGKLQAQLDDTKGMIAAMRPDAPFNALSTTLQASTQAFAGVQGAMALFGNESEDVQKILLKVQAAMALAEGAKSIDGLIDGFNQLKLVIAANPILAVATVVIALGTAAVATAASLDDLSAAENAQLEASKQAALATAEEAAKIGVLARIVDDSTQPYARRKEALDLLNQISPETFGNIKLEGLAYGAASKAAKNYTKKLIEQAEAKASLDLITEARKKQIEAESAAIRKSKGDLDFSDYLYILAGNEQQIYTNLQETWLKSQETIDHLSNSLYKTATAAENAEVPLDKLLDIQVPNTAAQKIGEVKDKVKELDNYIKQRPGFDILQWRNAFNKAEFNKMVKRVEADIEKAKTDFQQNPIEIPLVLVQENKQKKQNTGLTVKKDEAVKSVEELENLKKSLVDQSFRTAAGGFADAITAGITGGNVENVLAKTFGSILGLVGDFMIEYGLKTEAMALLMTQIQAAIALNPAMALPYAIALVAGGVALKGIAGSFGQAKTNKFADGGVLSTPTFGLMAEYPNAHMNKEIITPENLMAKVVRENSGGGMSGSLVAVVKGNDLHFILEQANRNRRRG